jgi:hypothetical protein
MDFRECGFHGFLGGLLVVVGLEIEPHFGRPAEIALEPQGSVHGEGAFTLHDLIDAAGGDANVPRHTVFGNTQRDQEILAENFAWVDGSVRFHGESVVIDDFDIVRAIGLPAKADAPLVVDADGVLAFSVTPENFQTVAGWDGEMVEFCDGVKLSEFSQSDALDFRR